jgi:hypothetical protein
VICPGCGGVVGRDCFNPPECEWITRELTEDARERWAQEYAAMEAAHYAELEKAHRSDLASPEGELTT